MKNYGDILLRSYQGLHGETCELLEFVHYLFFHQVVQSLLIFDLGLVTLGKLLPIKCNVI